tara:strand:- start:179 stop:433 length:255 start_codon:yes stop_codon:yes gene_type:complete
MYDLQRGAEQLNRLNLLFELTKIRSKNVRKAVELVLVNGYQEELAACAIDIDKKAIYRAIARLNNVNAIVEQIKEIDCGRRKPQ